MSLHEEDKLLNGADTQLSRLFAGYRESLPDPEPSPGFMPRLWEQIEARQSATRVWKRWAQAFLTAAMAVSLLLGIILAQPRHQLSPFYTSTYLELLASSDRDRDAGADVELVRVEHLSYENSQ